MQYVTVKQGKMQGLQFLRPWVAVLDRHTLGDGVVSSTRYLFSFTLGADAYPIGAMYLVRLRAERSFLV